MKCISFFLPFFPLYTPPPPAHFLQSYPKSLKFLTVFPKKVKETGRRKSEKETGAAPDNLERGGRDTWQLWTVPFVVLIILRNNTKFHHGLPGQPLNP